MAAATFTIQDNDPVSPPSDLGIVRASAGVGGSNPSLSDDGRFVAFTGSGFGSQIFVRDLQTNVLFTASSDAEGNIANDRSSNASMSGNGEFVSFTSRATNLVGDDTNGDADIFVKNLKSGSIVRATTDKNGSEVQFSISPDDSSLSSTGRYTVFDAYGRLVADQDRLDGIYVKDTESQNVVIASTDASGNQTMSGSYLSPSISDDGRFVAFVSNDNNLVANDTNGYDLFVKDLTTQSIVRANVDADGNQANSGFAFGAVMAGNGRYVAFTSSATNLVPNDTDKRDDVFVKDLETGAIVRASTDANGNEGDGSSGYIAGVPRSSFSISNDGRFVAFDSSSDNLVPNDTGLVDIFVKDLKTGAISRVNTDADGNPANNLSTGASISGDGRFIAFQSSASNLVPGDSGVSVDVFVVANPLYDNDTAEPPPPFNDAPVQQNFIGASIRLADFAYYSTPTQAIEDNWLPINSLDLQKIAGFSNGVHSGFPLPLLDTSAHAYAGILDGVPTVAIAFKGTDQPSVEIVGQVGRWDSYYQFHKPFVEAVLEWSKQTKETFPNLQVIVTGHSLGGVIVELMAADKNNLGVIAEQAHYITFGSPGSSAKAASDTKLLNFVHWDDPVPKLDFPLSVNREGTTISIFRAPQVVNLPAHKRKEYETSIEKLTENEIDDGHKLFDRYFTGGNRTLSIYKGPIDFQFLLMGGSAAFDNFVFDFAAGLGTAYLFGVTEAWDGITGYGFSEQNSIEVAGAFLEEPGGVTISEGSAVVKIDEDLDGIVDATITLVGDYDISLFQVSLTDVGTRITYGEGPPPRDNEILGTLSDDALSGTAGDDIIRGVAGNNAIEGLAGDDILFAGIGDDMLDGGEGNDQLYAYFGTNILRGGPGNDSLLTYSEAVNILDGEAGDDLLIGHNGPTIYRFAPHWGNDVIDEFHDRTVRIDAVDIISFMKGITFSALDFSLDTSFGTRDLLISHTDGDTLRIVDQFGGDLAKQVERVEFDDLPGQFIDITKLSDFVLVTDPAPNQAPIANNDRYDARDGIMLGSVNLLANDSDPDGDPLEVAGFDYRGAGTLDVRADGTFSYMPAAGFTGVDTFTYTIRDGFGAEDSATVSLTVANEVPIANDDSYDARNGIVLGSVNLLANDSDPDSDPLEVAGFDYRGAGTLDVLPDGTFSYAPAAGFTGTDTFT